MVDLYHFGQMIVDILLIDLYLPRQWLACITDLINGQYYSTCPANN